MTVGNTCTMRFLKEFKEVIYTSFLLLLIFCCTFLISLVHCVYARDKKEANKTNGLIFRCWNRNVLLTLLFAPNFSYFILYTSSFDLFFVPYLLIRGLLVFFLVLLIAYSLWKECANFGNLFFSYFSFCASFWRSFNATNWMSFAISGMVRTRVLLLLMCAANTSEINQLEWIILNSRDSFSRGLETHFLFTNLKICFYWFDALTTGIFPALWRSRNEKNYWIFILFLFRLNKHFNFYQNSSIA